MIGNKTQKSHINIATLDFGRRRNWADNLSEFICSSFIVCLYFLVEY
jgi:hypothetical protein